MASYYEVSKSIRITNSEPIDGDRYIANSINDRDKLVTPAIGIVRAHNGLQVYVKDVKKLFLLTDINATPATWVEISFGSGDLSYEYTAHEVTASDLWTINNHGLNKKPSVVIVGADNKEVTAEIEYLSDTEIRIYFNAPFAGKAFLN